MDVNTPTLEADEPQAIGFDSSWFDPLLQTVATAVLFTSVTLTFGQTKKIAVANPNRWGIGICSPNPGQQLNYAPWPDVGAFQFDQLTGSLLSKFYTLFNYGPLVCNDWWGVATSGGTFRIVELLRN